MSFHFPSGLVGRPLGDLLPPDVAELPTSGAPLLAPPAVLDDEFDYGYVLTVHKSQGSQWDDVVLFDESFAFQDSRARWLYTGITRAAKRLSVVV